GRGRRRELGRRVTADAQLREQLRRTPGAGHQRREEQQAPQYGVGGRQQLAENAGYAGDAAVAEPQYGGSQPDQEAAERGGEGGEEFHWYVLQGKWRETRQPPSHSTPAAAAPSGRWARPHRQNPSPPPDSLVNSARRVI